MQVIHSLRNSRSEVHQFDGATTVCLQDIERNPQLSLGFQFLDMRLWRNIEQSNRHLGRIVKRIIDRYKPKSSLKGDEMEPSFRDWYMKHMILEFENDLDEIRQMPSSKGGTVHSTSHDQIEVLLDCIGLALKSFDEDEADRL
jgi:hypothetical protein